MVLRKILIISYTILILVQILFLLFKYSVIEGIFNSDTSMYIVLFPTILILIPVIFTSIILYSLCNYKCNKE